MLEVAGEFISLLSVQLTALKPLVEPLAGYLENLWSETVHSDPSRHAIFDVSGHIVLLVINYWIVGHFINFVFT